MVKEIGFNGATPAERIALVNKQRKDLYDERAVLVSRIHETKNEADVQRASSLVLRRAGELEHLAGAATATKLRTAITIAGSFGAAVAPIIVPISDDKARGLGIVLAVAGGGMFGEKWKPFSRSAEVRERKRASKAYAKLRETTGDVSPHTIAKTIPHTKQTIPVVPLTEARKWIRSKQADLSFTANPENTMLPGDPRPRIVRTVYETQLAGRIGKISEPHYKNSSVDPKEIYAQELLVRAEVLNNFAHAQIEMHRNRASNSHIVGESARRIGNIVVPAITFTGFAEGVSRFIDSHVSGVAGIADDIPTWIAIGVSVLATTVAKRLNTDESPSTGQKVVDRKWAKKQHTHTIPRTTAAPDNRSTSHLARVIKTRQ